MPSFRKTPSLAAALVVVAVCLPGPAASASGGLTVKPLTWNVIGLDSNNVTVGPALFPVGARVCNTTASTASATTADIAFDSANAYISAFGPTTMALGDLAPNACADAYFNVQITRTSAAYDTSRAFHITATSGALSASTPANRELYVEKLVSQNRNSVDGMTSSAIDTAPSSSAAGHATVYLGHTYVFHVASHTATGGYSQLESEVTFPTPIFRVLSVAATYAVPSGGTNDAMYADACGWDNDTTSVDYRSCVGPDNYPSGNVGGNPIGTDYTVQVVGTGSGSVSTLIYDFSGSSYHYNSDFGLGATSVAFQAVSAPAAVDDSVTTTAGQAVTIPSLSNDTGGVAPLAVTAHSTPSNGSVTCTASSCTYTPIGGFVGSDSFTYTIADSKGTTSTATDTVTVNAAPILPIGPGSASQPAAVDDTAGTTVGTPVTLDPTLNDDLGATPSTVAVTTPAGSGPVTCTGTSCTYTPATGFSGTDSFGYTITDSNGATSSATVTVTVASVNVSDPGMSSGASTGSGSGTLTTTDPVVDPTTPSDSSTGTVSGIAPNTASGSPVSAVPDVPSRSRVVSHVPTHAVQERPAPAVALMRARLAMTGASLDALCLLAITLVGFGLPLTRVRRRADPS